MVVDARDPLFYRCPDLEVCFVTYALIFINFVQFLAFCSFIFHKENTKGMILDFINGKVYALSKSYLRRKHLAPA